MNQLKMLCIYGPKYRKPVIQSAINNPRSNLPYSLLYAELSEIKRLVCNAKLFVRNAAPFFEIVPPHIKSDDVPANDRRHAAVWQIMPSA